MMTLDFQEVFQKILRYLFLGLIVGLSGVYLIKGARMNDVVMVALTAAASLALLDLVGLGSTARAGLAFKVGTSLAGLPAGF